MRLCAFLYVLWLSLAIVACTSSGNAQEPPDNASFTVVTTIPSEEEHFQQETSDQTRVNDNCDEAHPEAQRIAEDFDVSPEEVMDWFCTGIGFGEIKQAYRIHTETETPVEDILALFNDGMEWGVIRAQLGAAPGDEMAEEE